MKTFLRPVTLFALLILVASLHPAQSAGARTFKASRDSSFLKYRMVHPLHEFEAVSNEVDCSIQYADSAQAITAASFSADVTTFDSGNSNRDSHAMEALDALTYPTVSFQSSSITGSGSDLLVYGSLTFHGQTKPAVVNATVTRGGGQLTVDGTANVSLTDFGIDRPSLMLIPVQDTIRISFRMAFPMK